MTGTPVTVRFAPSPTGRLHVGNVRAALINWLFARAHGGEFLLRLDDTDTERSTQEFADGIEADLAWLGLTWNRFSRQSQRMERYAAAAERLKAADRLYPCWESEEELALKRRVQLAAGRPPVYDRAALRLSEEEKRAKLAAGETPHWRFLLDPVTVEWEDLVRGPSHQDMASQSDPVLVRADGTPVYSLASVVDDIELGVTHIIRGEDHVTNSATQIQMFAALGAAAPAMGHLPLIADADGKGLSKRLGSLSVAALRDDGIEAMAINSLLAGLGSADHALALTLDDLVARFDITGYGRSTPRFDPEDLNAINAKLLHATPFAAVADRLAALGVGGGEAFWLAVRGNLARLVDAAEWWRVATASLAPAIAPEDLDFCAAAAELLPPGEPDAATWAAWTEALKSATGRKGRGLFMPLRRALTGRERGPELADLLPILGRERAVARLRGQTA